MADSFGKKEREKKKLQKRKEKELRKQQLKESGAKTVEFMYMGADGQLTTEKPDDITAKAEVSLNEISISVPKKEDLEEVDFSKTGVVKFFNADKGYGFIIESGSSDSFFVHVNNITEPIKDGDKVTFKEGKGPKGAVALEVALKKE